VSSRLRASRRPRSRGASITATCAPARFECPEEMWDVLQAEAHRAGRSTSDLVREAITVYLAFLAAVRVSDQHENLRVLLDDLLRQAVARDD
jgi:hypothetical protein